MAKKAAAKKPTARERDPGKTRFELRFDDDLYAQAKDLADRAGISVNQLMQGMTRWLVQRAKVGEPYRDDDGYVRVRQQEGCVWVGEKGTILTWEDQCELAEQYGGKPEDQIGAKGEIALFLDFTERRVVRDDV